MNQEAVIDGPLRGYGELTVGPVGSTPTTQFLSPKGKQAATRSRSTPARPRRLLTSHGWKVVPTAVSTCANPATVRAGDQEAGKPLSFAFPYASGVAWIQSKMTQLQSNAAPVGIKLNVEPKTFSQVRSAAGGNCVVAQVPCNWDMANFGNGWSFSPDFLPTGDELFHVRRGRRTRRVLQPRPTTR